MIVGIGIDICDIIRIKKILSQREKHFLDKIFNNEEVYITSIRAENIAGKFATKEAFYKACSTLNLKPKWKDISVLNYDNGAPYILINNHELGKELKKYKIWVSISHEKTIVVSVVIIEQ